MQNVLLMQIFYHFLVFQSEKRRCSLLYITEIYPKQHYTLYI